MVLTYDDGVRKEKDTQNRELNGPRSLRTSWLKFVVNVKRVP
jgi:hypothetical protein